MWKGIRNLILFKHSPKLNIRLLSHNSETITDTKNKANIFNDYFSTIAKEAKTKIRFSITLLMIHFSLRLQIVMESKI